MFSLFDEEYDEEATVKSVKTLLGSYKKMNNFAKRYNSIDEMSLQSTEITDMPSAHAVANSAEDKLIRAISPGVVTKWHCVHCRHAIEAIEDDDQRYILYHKYIKNQTSTAISIELNLPKETYRRHLHEACLTFAEIYGLEELRIKKGEQPYLTLESILELNEQET